MLRIFRALPKLRLLVRGIAHSMSSVGYVATLLLMHFFLFAVVGVSVFSTNDAEHFGNLGSAFLTLFQVLTLENWPDVMAPVKAAHPVVGVAYFVGFIVTGTMVVMNLFVGVIVGGMSEAIQEEKSSTPGRSADADAAAEVRASLGRIAQDVRRLENRVRSLSARIPPDA
jgi:voltage-gated sodium channel